MFVDRASKFLEILMLFLSKGMPDDAVMLQSSVVLFVLGVTPCFMNKAIALRRRRANFFESAELGNASNFILKFPGQQKV